MARPQPPFNYPPLTDRNGFELAPGCFYDWEVGGHVLTGSSIYTAITYALLPGNVWMPPTSTSLPPYSPLAINRERYTANNQSVSFWFVVRNNSGATLDITPGSGWTMSAFSIDVGGSALVVVLDTGSTAIGYLAGITTAGGAGGVTSISDGAPGVGSGTSELTITPDPITGTGTLALAATAATAGPWGSGTQVPQITLSAGGRVTAASNVAISPITINTVAPISGGAAVAPGGSLTLNHGLTSVTAGNYGSSTQVATFTVNASGHLTAAANVAIAGGSLGSITVTPSGPLTVTGSPVSLGGTITLTNTALNSVGTRSWVAGTGAAVTGGNADSVAIGNNALAQNACVSIGSGAGTNASFDSVVVGYNTGVPTWGGSVVVGSRIGNLGTGPINAAVIIGYLAGQNQSSSNGCTYVGAQAGRNATSGADNTALGNGAGPTAGAPAIARTVCIGGTATAAADTAIAIGYLASSTASNATAIGANVTNSTANSCLIGDTTAYVTRSAGFLQSAAWYSCKAGRSTGTQTITFPGPVTLTINNTVWTSGCAVSGNNITMPQANTQFSVNACALVNAFTGPAASTIVMRIRYFDGTTTSTLTSCTLQMTASTPAGASWCCGGTLQTPNVTTGYVFVELERLAGTTTSVDITQWSLAVKRDA